MYTCLRLLTMPCRRRPGAVLGGRLGTAVGAVFRAPRGRLGHALPGDPTRRTGPAPPAISAAPCPAGGPIGDRGPYSVSGLQMPRRRPLEASGDPPEGLQTPPETSAGFCWGLQGRLGRLRRPPGTPRGLSRGPLERAPGEGRRRARAGPPSRARSPASHSGPSGWRGRHAARSALPSAASGSPCPGRGAVRSAASQRGRVR